jgi:hypothetical protein
LFWYQLYVHLTNGSTAVAVLYCYPQDNGAMTRLNLSKNKLLTEEGGRALGNMLKANTILKELDVSDSGNGMLSHQKDAPGFVTAISEGLAGNRAMTSLNLASNDLGVEGAKVIAAVLPKCT